jgi:ABC-type amino acid transport system permease subunit
MVFKIALVVALTSMWAMVRYGRDRQDETGLTREVETHLQALRDELFRR